MNLGGEWMMADVAILGRAAALGVVAGMRSLAAPAALSRHLAHDPVVPANRIELLLTHPSASRVLGLASAVEHVADKLPIIPDRTEPGPLAGRMVAGALCGAVLARRAGESAAAGALVGALAAAAATFAARELRRALTSDGGLPGLPVALAEDIGAIALAEAALRD